MLPHPAFAARSAQALALAASLAAGGCLFATRDGPVPKSLVACRQLSQRGMSAIERGDWAEAEELLSQAVSAFPDDPEARCCYAETLWHRDAKADAVAQLDEAVRLSDADPKPHIRLAEMHLDLQSFDAASVHVERALALDGRSPEAWRLRGRLCEAAGDEPSALADYHRALAYDPFDRQALFRVAELHRAAGRPGRALAHLRSLAATYPQGDVPGDVSVLTGRALADLGRHDEAQVDFAESAGRTRTR